MARISLEGMRFFAFHGVYPEEQILGTDYLVTVAVETSIVEAAKTDDLAKTVNYETIYQAVKIEMEDRHDLIETLIDAIVNRLKFQFATLAAVDVLVKKLNPPLGGRVAFSAVEVEKVFLQECPRDRKPFVCYGDDTCWCRNPEAKPTWPATQETLKGQYKKCLCPTCVAFFAG